MCARLREQRDHSNSASSSCRGCSPTWAAPRRSSWRTWWRAATRLSTASATLRFDYRGHGATEGPSFGDTHPGEWLDDALLALDALTDEGAPQVLVGSSMGGLIALHMALRRPERVAALVLIAPAVGFLARRRAALSVAQRAALAAGGRVALGSDYVAPGADAVGAAFFDAGAAALALPGDDGNDGGGGGDDGGEEEELLAATAAAILIDAPVRILHGARDDVVPPSVSRRLVSRLRGADVTLTVVKDGDHRLSGARDLALLEAAVAQVVRQLRDSDGGGGGGGGAGGGSGGVDAGGGSGGDVGRAAGGAVAAGAAAAAAGDREAGGGS